MTRATQRRFGSRAVLAAVAVLLVAVPFAVLLVLVTRTSSPLSGLDNTVEQNLHSYALDHATFTDVMRAVSTVGAPGLWWLILPPIFGWRLVVRDYRRATFVAVTALGSALLNTVLKSAVDRTRPRLLDPIAHARGSSFPSSHAQSAIVGFGIVVVIFWPYLRARGRVVLCAAASAGALLIGFSRIALGVHFLSDVVGAAIIGAAWLLAMTAAFDAWRVSPRGHAKGAGPTGPAPSDDV